MINTGLERVIFDPAPTIEELLGEEGQETRATPPSPTPGNLPQSRPQITRGVRFGVRSASRTVPGTAIDETFLGRIKECFSCLKTAIVNYNSSEKKLERQVTAVGKELAKLLPDVVNVANAEIAVALANPENDAVSGVNIGMQMFRQLNSQLEEKRKAIYEKIPLKGLSQDEIANILRIAQSAYRCEVKKLSRFAVDDSDSRESRLEILAKDHRYDSILKKVSVATLEIGALRKHLVAPFNKERRLKIAERRLKIAEEKELQKLDVQAEEEIKRDRIEEEFQQSFRQLRDYKSREWNERFDLEKEEYRQSSKIQREEELGWAEVLVCLEADHQLREAKQAHERAFVADQLAMALNQQDELNREITKLDREITKMTEAMLRWSYMVTEAHKFLNENGRINYETRRD